MGLFKHKDKTKQDQLNPLASHTPSAETPRPHRTNDSQRNSYHDSTYYSSSNISTADSRASQLFPQRPAQSPGTTITTTTTTTTTPDGTTQIYCHPYNPTTDPPQEVSETKVDKKLPANAGTRTGISQPIPQHTSQTTFNSQNPTITRTGNRPDRLASPQTQGRPSPTFQETSPTPGTSNPSSFTQPPSRKPTPQHHGGTQSQHPPPNESSILRTSSTGSSHRVEVELPASPLSPITIGGRPIPPRSDFRLSLPNKQEPIPALVPEGPVSPVMPERSQWRLSRDNIVAPLNVSLVHRNQSQIEDPASVTRERNGGIDSYNHGFNLIQPAGTGYDESVASNRISNEPLSPVSPFTAASSFGRPKTPNFSRPGATVTGQSPSTAPAIENQPAPSPSSPVLGTTTSVSGEMPPQQKPVGKRQSFAATLKGLHGAGEALRGSVNETIAHVSHDQVEEERMRAVREKGMGEWKGSGLETRSKGLRDGFREKAERRIRTRRASQERDGVQGSERLSVIEAVKEADH
ncbi:hypothetical protein BUE80_DR006546 [Diplocarpon rosae]|nr:hypothetical protein BUE80_DR006546 [Diplocarpon rosae]